MRPLLFASASLLALLAAAPKASAATTTFSYTGALVDFEVPATGEYLITAYGAQGGSVGGADSAAGGRSRAFDLGDDGDRARRNGRSGSAAPKERKRNMIATRLGRI